MLEQQERLWEYDAVEPGQTGRPTVVEITAENIAEYAVRSQNPDPRFRLEGNDPAEGANPEFPGAAAAMPTMALSYAPLLRDDIADNSGFVALEQSKTARRQTPFAKCEARWFAPVRAGDTITGNRRVLEKYERRGSRFVTFRVECDNQDGVRVAEYDYTCIFHYAGGQRSVPQERPEPETAPAPAPQDVPAPAAFLRFDGVSVGDNLASLAITESQEVINRKNEFRLAGKPSESNIHTDEEFARQNIFGGMVNAGPATMSYVDQMLERNFPLRAFYDGGSLLMRAITPFRSGDTVVFEGEVTGKREEDGRKLVDCRVRGTNQRGELVCLADATMALAG